MNTRNVKNEAISIILGDMFKHTTTYSSNSITCHNDPIEPDRIALDDFRLKLSAIAALHSLRILSADDISRLKSWMYDIGFKYGHITSIYTTGVWGVRYTQLDDIITIMQIDDYDLLPYKSTYHLYDKDYTITEYKVTSFALFATLKPDNPEHNSFQISFYWNEFIKDNSILRYTGGVK